MAITGLRTTANFATNERPTNWREGILYLMPNGKAPLTALTAAMKSRAVDDFQFNWWEKPLQSRRVQLNGNITASTTSWTVTAASSSQGGAKQFKAGDTLFNFATSEYVRVVSDPTSDTVLEVSRGQRGSTATAITITTAGQDNWWYSVGSAFEQGSSAPTGVGFDPTQVTGYCQIFRQTFEATNTALATRLRTKDAALEAKRECLELFSVDMERAFFLGKGTTATINGKPVGYTDGLINRTASSNIFTWGTANGDYAGTTTWADFETIMRIWFDYGSGEKVVFGGSVALLNMQRLIRYAKGIHWQMEPAKEFGMNVTRVTCPFGQLILKQHPLFTQMAGGTTGTGYYYGMNSWLFCVDMANISYAYVKGRDVKYEKDLQDNGVDGLKSGYIAECGLEIHHAATHGILKSFVSYTAES